MVKTKLNDTRDAFERMKALRGVRTDGEAARIIGMNESVLRIQLAKIEDGKASGQEMRELANPLNFSAAEFRELINNPQMGQPINKALQKISARFASYTADMEAVESVVGSIASGDVFTIITRTPVKLEESWLNHLLSSAINSGARCRLLLCGESLQLQRLVSALLQDSTFRVVELAFCSQATPLFRPADRYLLLQRKWTDPLCIRSISAGLEPGRGQGNRSYSIEREVSEICTFAEEHTWKKLA